MAHEEAFQQCIHWETTIYGFPDVSTRQILTWMHGSSVAMGTCAIAAGSWLLYQYITKKKRFFATLPDRPGIRPMPTECLVLFITSFMVIDLLWHVSMLAGAESILVGHVLQNTRYTVGYAALILYMVGIIYSIPASAKRTLRGTAKQHPPLSLFTSAILAVPSPPPLVLDTFMFGFTIVPTVATVAFAVTLGVPTSDATNRGVHMALWSMWGFLVAVFGILMGLYGHQLVAVVLGTNRTQGNHNQNQQSPAKPVGTTIQRSSAAAIPASSGPDLGSSLNSSARLASSAGTAALGTSLRFSTASPGSSAGAPLLAGAAPDASWSSRATATTTGAAPAGDLTKPRESVALGGTLTGTQRLSMIALIQKLSQQRTSSRSRSHSNATGAPGTESALDDETSRLHGTSSVSASTTQNTAALRRQLQAMLMSGVVRRMQLTFTVLPLSSLVFAAVNLMHVLTAVVDGGCRRGDAMTGYDRFMFWVPLAAHTISGTSSGLIVLCGLAWEARRSGDIQGRLRGTSNVVAPGGGAPAMAVAE
ncbi:hypothetical protein H9P43_007760 [Blastocladiella emersonii ATCC 22665]|nr:hypothetical protein H9P43_007760 [Blastocladiella emersonii ATCC 22665]